MQPLTDPILRPYTAAQVTALLTGPAVRVASGLELLDTSNRLLADISDKLVSGGIARHNLATIHGTCTLNIDQQLVWGADRVRPYMILTDPTSGVACRWNLGVYVMATPNQQLGSIPETYAVTGSDLLYLLNDPVGDSYSVPAGADVLTAMRAAITAAAGSVPVLLDGTAAGKTLPAAMVWPLTQSTVSTWLDVINDLGAAISYRGLWCDWDGNYRSEPYVNPGVRAPEFVFTADDEYLSIVAEGRTVTDDLWGAPNWWRFVASSWPTTPVEGNGQYTVQNVNAGPASQTAIGRTIRKVTFVTAADQASLQAQGDTTVAADNRTTKTITVQLSPAPMQWHWDVATYVDAAAGGSMKVQTDQWTLDLGGADGQTQWEMVG